MARITLVPQRHEFFVLYNRAAANAVEIAKKLIELLDVFPNNGALLVQQVKDLEHEGDRLTHEVVDLLNRTFVTPFDRDDMYRLATAIDDVCDHVDEAAGGIGGYGVTEVRQPAKELATVILRAAEKLSEAVERLDGFRDSSTQLIELREYEDEGDRILREALSELFHSERDAISIIRWKDIYERLEDAVDAEENAADVLEAIVVKNR
jgi:uncharacterized protein